MENINWLGIGVAAFSAFVLGGIWYSKALFADKWAAAAGLTEKQIKGANMGKTLGLSFLLSVVAAFVFSMFIGPKPEMGFALGAGFSVGLCWVTASFGINYLFEQKPLSLFLINGGYHTLQFTVYGLVLALI